MSKTLTAEQALALEALIDQTSLGAVLEAIQTICHEKADHLRSNWQDYGAAPAAWMKAGGMLTRAAFYAFGVGL